MSKMQIVLLILFFAGVGIGFLLDFSGVELQMLSLLLNIFIIAVVLYYGYYFYIMLISKNVSLVDKYISKRSKHPYYALLTAMVKKQYSEAERYMNKLGSIYNQTKIALASSIQLETRQLREAEKNIKKIKNKNIHNHNFALLALMNGDTNLFEKYKSQVKHKGLQYALEAEAAYARGEMDQAEKFGELAISTSAGVQKWVFVKSLEYQKQN
ncbi:hypothetical protein [Paenibacillus harenae]|uniref:Uncharacterized protein n=1 Tax=Paenibacillus harenae TaxID=306543 RepID=A0ABT9TZ14_PAEHA|nr:hypothetical protein [Paenibacillus harenae]MDQ0112548.1 hypothetical protein [Paenibacillus harenae]